MNNENAIGDIMEICKDGTGWKNRTEEQKKDDRIKYRKLINEYGFPVLRKNFDGTVQILFTKEIKIDKLRDEAMARHQYKIEQIFGRDGNNSGTITKWKCPLCRESPFLMRVLHPMYPGGFLNKGGVLQQCACVESRVAERRKLYATKGKQKGERFSGQNAGVDKDSQELDRYSS